MQPALHNPGNSMVVASAHKVRPGAKQVDCISEDGLQFSVAYDTLVTATGSQARPMADTPYCNPLSTCCSQPVPLPVTALDRI